MCAFIFICFKEVIRNVKNYKKLEKFSDCLWLELLVSVEFYFSITISLFGLFFGFWIFLPTIVTITKKRSSRKLFLCFCHIFYIYINRKFSIKIENCSRVSGKSVLLSLHCILFYTLYLKRFFLPSIHNSPSL